MIHIRRRLTGGELSFADVHGAAADAARANDHQVVVGQLDARAFLSAEKAVMPQSRCRWRRKPLRHALCGSR